MPESSFALLALVIVAALVFDFINGFHDTANAIATCISTRALSIRDAILMAAGLNFVGALVSTHVATTIGKEIVDPSQVTQVVVLSALIGAIFWDLLTWRYGIPSSSSHAIIGGLIGAVVAERGWGVLKWEGITKILAAIVISPLAGTLIAFLIMVGIFWIFRGYHPSPLNRGFRKLQIVSAAFMAFSHGSNDAQKSMGVITLALTSYGAIHTFHIPLWVILSCAVSMAVGTAMGGWRIIKTVGTDIVKLSPVHGFCAETSSAGVILTASAMGIPISTTHVITSAILGVGLSQGHRRVNWMVGARIVWAWILTIPAAAAAGYFSYDILGPLFLLHR
ncbi:MAG: inorganic phosphate transporter [Deltaproteobacteria bacterium RBG_19FT_COMBO_60_16]|nr:MAG: inorganic phosphate transporter [Deltaproteobacteria bacterium RBG_16_64_85]OGQ00599.1 MAG: inorganic phosphate transporter [Deltaproteobacteria bacterium RBG_19FT_COMBO_60_16]